LLAPRKRLEKVFQDRSMAESPFFQGWRAEILKPVMSDIEGFLTS